MRGEKHRSNIASVASVYCVCVCLCLCLCVCASVCVCLCVCGAWWSMRSPHSSGTEFIYSKVTPRICLQYRRLGSNPWAGKIPWRRAWKSTPVFLTGESHGRGDWRAAVHGITKSWTWLKWLSTVRSTKGIHLNTLDISAAILKSTSYMRWMKVMIWSFSTTREVTLFLSILWHHLSSLPLGLCPPHIGFIFFS